MKSTIPWAIHRYRGSMINHKHCAQTEPRASSLLSIALPEQARLLSLCSNLSPKSEERPSKLLSGNV